MGIKKKFITYLPVYIVNLIGPIYYNYQSNHALILLFLYILKNVQTH